MNNRNIDIKFLKEYSYFSCKGSLVAGRVLYTSFKDAIKIKDYDLAAHLLIKLNSEMIAMFELVSALLYSFSNVLSQQI